MVQPPQTILAAGYSFADWKVFTLVSTTSILVPYSFYFFGLQYLTPTRAIITSTLEPIVAIATEFIFLGGTMGPLQIAGAVLVIGSIILLETTSGNGRKMWNTANEIGKKNEQNIFGIIKAPARPDDCDRKYS